MALSSTWATPEQALSKPCVALADWLAWLAGSWVRGSGCSTLVNLIQHPGEPEEHLMALSSTWATPEQALSKP